MSQPELRLECLVVELFGSRAASLSGQRKRRIKIGIIAFKLCDNPCCLKLNFFFLAPR